MDAQAKASSKDPRRPRRDGGARGGRRRRRQPEHGERGRPSRRRRWSRRARSRCRTSGCRSRATCTTSSSSGSECDTMGALSIVDRLRCRVHVLYMFCQLQSMRPITSCRCRWPMMRILSDHLPLAHQPASTLLNPFGFSL